MTHYYKCEGYILQLSEVWEGHESEEITEEQYLEEQERLAKKAEMLDSYARGEIEKTDIPQEYWEEADLILNLYLFPPINDAEALQIITGK